MRNIWKQIFFTGVISLYLFASVGFLLSANPVRAGDIIWCFSPITNKGYCMGNATYQAEQDQYKYDCAGGTWNTIEECQAVPHTKSGEIAPTNPTPAPTPGSGTGSAGSSKSSESSGSGASTPSKPSASTPAAGSSATKPAIFGAPTNLGNPKGTPKPGGSVFLPECATDEGQGPGHGCRDVGAFISLFINYANGTLAIIGAVAFLFFIYGGVMLLISAGEAERVKKGRDAIMGAIIGILIVFGAQMLVRFVIQGLVPTENQDPVNKLQVKLPDTTEKK